MRDPVFRCRGRAPQERGAAPSFPQAFIAALDGVKIGPRVGSCGTAAYRKETVIVSDIATDPLWADYRELALAYGLQAGWSTPVLPAEEKVLGTFGIYAREPRSPTPQQRKLIEQFADLASIAIEHTRAQEALRRSEAYLAKAQGLSQTGSFGWKVSTFEQRLLMPDRTIKHVHVVAQAVRNESGTLEFVGALMDVTKRKSADEALRASEQVARGQVEALMRDYFVAAGTKKFLAVPILTEGQVRGMITVRHGERAPYRTEEVELTQALAHQVMLAIRLTEVGTFETQGKVPVLPPAWQENSLRIGQEALSNTLKYAHACLSSMASRRSKRFARPTRKPGSSCSPPSMGTKTFTARSKPARKAIC